MTPKEHPPTPLLLRVQRFANALHPEAYGGLGLPEVIQSIAQSLTILGAEWLEDMAAQDARPPRHGIEAANRERARQIKTEGYDPAHDDRHNTEGELADAAKGYLSAYAYAASTGTLPPSWPSCWPWHPDTWKPSLEPQRNLEKAMALLAAEWDRLERAKQEQPL